MFRNTVMYLLCKKISRLNVRLLSNNLTEVNHLEKTLNQVNLLGRAGGDPQKRGTEEHPVVIFSLATHTNYRVEGAADYVQRTDWHRVCVFKPYLRDTVYENLKKGQRILVNGRLSYGEIKDESGKLKSTTSIIADDVIFFQFPRKSDRS